MRSIWQQASAPPTDWDDYAPNHASLVVSDVFEVAEQSSDTLKFLRPVSSAVGYDNIGVGARVSFKSNTSFMRIVIYWNALVTRSDTFNSVGVILVDGVKIETFSSNYAYDAAEYQVFSVFTPLSGTKEFTIIFPYGAAAELREISVSDGATFAAGTARPSAKIACFGDSTTHGYTVANTIETWPYLLGEAKTRQVYNLGNGSQLSSTSDGTEADGCGAAAITYMIGFNDFAAGVTVATFQTNIEDWITAARTTHPSAHLYIISPLYTTQDETDYGRTASDRPMSDYRAAVLAAEAAAGDGNTTYIDGLTLMTNSSDRLVDGIHPNSTGAAEIATALATAIA